MRAWPCLLSLSMSCELHVLQNTWRRKGPSVQRPCSPALIPSTRVVQGLQIPYYHWLASYSCPNPLSQGVFLQGKGKPTQDCADMINIWAWRYFSGVLGWDSQFYLATSWLPSDMLSSKCQGLSEELLKSLRTVNRKMQRQHCPILQAERTLISLPLCKRPLNPDPIKNIYMVIFFFHHTERQMVLTGLLYHM